MSAVRKISSFVRYKARTVMESYSEDRGIEVKGTRNRVIRGTRSGNIRLIRWRYQRNIKVTA